MYIISEGTLHATNIPDLLEGIVYMSGVTGSFSINFNGNKGLYESRNIFTPTTRRKSYSAYYNDTSDQKTVLCVATIGAYARTFWIKNVIQQIDSYTLLINRDYTDYVQDIGKTIFHTTSFNWTTCEGYNTDWVAHTQQHYTDNFRATRAYRNVAGIVTVKPNMNEALTVLFGQHVAGEICAKAGVE